MLYVHIFSSQNHIYLTKSRRRLSLKLNVLKDFVATFLRDADVIFVLHGGRVVESGTHEQLLDIPNGVYKKLWNTAASS
jgi:hypothetical protein